jgi:hypothetical protein
MEAWSLLISKRIRPKRLSFNKLIMVGAEGFEPPTLCSQSDHTAVLNGFPWFAIECNRMPETQCPYSLPTVHPLRG